MKSLWKKICTIMLCLVMSLSLAACKNEKKPIEPDITNENQNEENQGGDKQAEDITSAAAMKDGVYETSADGMNGSIKVKTTIEGGKIAAVEILEHTETPGISDSAIEDFPQQIVNSNSIALDAISGATITSNAVLLAVSNAIIEAGGNLDDFKNIAVTADEKVEKMETDIVVIGAGASGVTAAVAASDNGANVIIIEKTGVIGGASNLSWAGKFINSSIALESGSEVDEEKIIADWIADCHWRVDAAAIRQYVTQSGATYDWLKEHGYATIFLNFAGEQMHMLPFDYGSRETLLRSMLADSVEKNGGQVLTNTTGKSLITDGDGNVIGVIAQKSDGTKLEISAKSVIMATGGYAANAEMVAESFGFKGVNGGLGQNVGEGLKMAWEVGAKVPDNFGGQMLHQTIVPSTASLKKDFDSFKASYPLMLSYLPNFMNVGPSGSRFRDEAATLVAVEAANTSAFQGPFHYVIVSKAQIDALETNGMIGVNAPRLPGMPPEFYTDFAEEFTLENPWADVYSVLDKMVEGGYGFKGENPEELAQKAGMNISIFAEEFALYEEACSTGVDGSFNKTKDYLIPMGSEGPYYAIKAEINNLGSVGGLLVNTKFQVLDENRIPIKGLYAVGLESEGVLFNDTYVGNGVGIGYAFTSGRLGGASAAKELQK